jgi:hypothetical protein
MAPQRVPVDEPVITPSVAPCLHRTMQAGTLLFCVSIFRVVMPCCRDHLTASAEEGLSDAFAFVGRDTGCPTERQGRPRPSSMLIPLVPGHYACATYGHAFYSGQEQHPVAQIPLFRPVRGVSPYES